MHASGPEMALAGTPFERVQSLPYRSWVEVSRPQIAANFHSIQTTVGSGVEIMPVVKADAYRHGAIEVSHTLEAAGARWLAVSNTDEGVALRDSGIRTRILVMADCLPFTREAMIEHGLTPVVYSLETVRELNELAARRGIRLRVHLKIDSGMGRLGVRAGGTAIAEAVRSAPHLDFEGLMTHFASASNYGSRQTDEQIQYFEGLADSLRVEGVAPPILHLSSSIPVAYGKRKAWRQLVRPGHAIYGYVSPARGHAPQRILQVKPALSWRACVLSVKELPPGAAVGYGAMFTTPRRMRVAVLAAGYADGVPHRLSNRGHVIAHGRFAPILGAVSMDMMTVDVSESMDIQVGDAVTLLGSEGAVSVDAQEMAKLAGTISYSVLCGIHARVKRIYL